MTDAPVHAELADRAEDGVLRRQPRMERADELDEHRARSGLRQGLGREDVLHLRRADREGERAQGAVRGRVRVAAHERQPGLREAHLRPDHVDDPLAPRSGRVELDPELRAVLSQRLQLEPRELVGHRPVRRRHAVVHRRDGQLGSSHTAPGQSQSLERLRRGHLVDEVEVDVEQRRLARHLTDDVLLPDLLEQGGAHVPQAYRRTAGLHARDALPRARSRRSGGGRGRRPRSPRA